MPNGFPYLLRASEDGCARCGEQLCDHDRERVRRDDDRWGYEYQCLDGGRYKSPVRGGV